MYAHQLPPFRISGDAQILPCKELWIHLSNISRVISHTQPSTILSYKPKPNSPAPTKTQPSFSLTLAELPKTLLQNVFPDTVISVLGTPPHVLARSSIFILSPSEVDRDRDTSSSSTAGWGNEQDCDRLVESILRTIS